MNTILIAFLVVVILVAIYLSVQFFNPSYLIRDSAKLNVMNNDNPSNTVQSSINVRSIDSPGSVRYFYESWIYINTNAPVDSANVLFNRGADFVVTLTGSTLGLYVNTTLGGGKGVNNKGILDTSGLKPLATIANFPFQKWTQLVINVDGMSVDMYLDGKFVQNVKNSTPIGTSLSEPITYGNQYTIGNITRFRRPATSINPQGVWSSYMLGSGQNNSVTNYHLNARITKNKEVRVDQRIF